MKKYTSLLVLLVYLLLPVYNFAQSGNWVWLKGADSTSFGDYGTLGVSSPSNEPPFRYQAAYWSDLEGNFWVFGGSSLNDLWKYNPITNEWTWVHGPKLATSPSAVYGTMGVPSVLNNPDNVGYGANCWTDSIGDLWLFSGYSSTSTVSNDILWRYHIATDEWTWMKGTVTASYTNPIYGPKGLAGSTYTSGARQECKSAWVYKNKLWLFGGLIKGFIPKNDLWSYDIASNNWAWEAGSAVDYDLGSYGTKGVSSASNAPPSRYSYTRWQDPYNNFYLFAGSNSYQDYNDVWKYDHSNKFWTWISGTNIVGDTGTNSSFCLPDVNSIPKSRYENTTAQTASICTKSFWSFGGFGKSSVTFYNDLWLFNTTNLEWTKVKGAYGSPPPFSYGTKGIVTASNLLPGRGGSCAWSDNNGCFYIFGGMGRNISGGTDIYNDLWKFIPDTSCFHTGLVGGIKLTVPSDSFMCVGDTILMAIPRNASITVNPSTGNSINTVAGTISFFAPSRYTITAASLDPNEPCSKYDTAAFTLHPYPSAISNFNISPSYAYINNPTFNFLNTSSNAARYEWYYNGILISSGLDMVYKFTSVGMHCVTLVAINKCGQRDSVTRCCYVLDTTKMIARLDTTICIGDTIRINIPLGAKIMVNPITNFSLDSANHTLKLYPNGTINYTIIAQPLVPVDLGLPNDTADININVFPFPKANFSIAPPYGFTNKATFYYTNLSLGSILNYEWYYNGQLISMEKDLVKTYSDTGLHCITLVAINQCGQRDSLTQCCNVYEGGKLTIPNAFSPNNDGKNDGFKVVILGAYQKFSLIIMNRYGQEIFKTDDPNKEWDGKVNNKDEDLGVYYYMVKVKFDYPGAGEETYKGDISLIR
jgi:gliding motility-associated-like protein